MTRSDGIGSGHVEIIDQTKLEIATTLCAAMLRSSSVSYHNAEMASLYALSAADKLIKGCMKK